jgi:hypothetical protein
LIKEELLEVLSIQSYHFKQDLMVEYLKVKISELGCTYQMHEGNIYVKNLSALIFMLNRGFNLQIAIDNCLAILSTYSNHQETTEAIKDALALHSEGEPDYYKVNKLGQGWVGEEALAISLYCALCYSNDFEKAINLAINHDGDTDSTGAITGNILGLMLGEEAIPQRWLNNLNNYNEIKQVAIDLYDAANSSTEAGWRRRFMD